jgi:hypothetical protein
MLRNHRITTPDHEFLFFSFLLQLTSRGGDLGSSCLDSFLDNVVR